MPCNICIPVTKWLNRLMNIFTGWSGKIKQIFCNKYFATILLQEWFFADKKKFRLSILIWSSVNFKIFYSGCSTSCGMKVKSGSDQVLDNECCEKINNLIKKRKLKRLLTLKSWFVTSLYLIESANYISL